MTVEIFSYLSSDKSAQVYVHVVHLHKFGKATGEVVVNIADVVRCTGVQLIDVDDRNAVDRFGLIHWSMLFDTLPESISWPINTMFVSLRTLISLNKYTFTCVDAGGVGYRRFVNWLTDRVFTWIVVETTASQFRKSSGKNFYNRQRLRLPNRPESFHETIVYPGRYTNAGIYVPSRLACSVCAQSK